MISTPLKWQFNKQKLHASFLLWATFQGICAYLEPDIDSDTEAAFHPQANLGIHWADKNIENIYPMSFHAISHTSSILNFAFFFSLLAFCFF